MTDITKHGLIDTTVSEHLKREHFAKFSSSIKFSSDYWYIWVKSGVIEYLCEKLKSKYKIRRLNYIKDYVTWSRPLGDDDTVEMEEHKFYDKWRNKVKFRRELNSYLEQLRLPRLAFDPLFERIFYNHPLQIKQPWPGYDSNSVFTPLGLSEDNHVLKNTYTKQEVKEITQRLRDQLVRMRVPISDKIEGKIKKYTDGLVRGGRILQNPKLYVAVIKELKVYRKVGIWNDYTDDSGAADKGKGRQIAEKCAARIVKNLGIDSFTGSAFRKKTLEIYADFPLVKEFIESGQSVKN